ncbi:hypothetical protein LLE49_26275 [Alicyclobacillus tolerans]|uniref:hypothetical protein n=1 Tax=Alicyclobacillus tolerans TaxID=90970 RepID=UPI001F1A9E82|nr:hypothetical protein [Alicyclobacillus tolerans]MCF8568233.1 hypothetical protein [Alicyclobacillus tolerans]
MIKTQAELFKHLMEQKRHIIVAGGPGVGKTRLLKRLLMSHKPPKHLAVVVGPGLPAYAGLDGREDIFVIATSLDDGLVEVEDGKRVSAIVEAMRRTPDYILLDDIEMVSGKADDVPRLLLDRCCGMMLTSVEATNEEGALEQLRRRLGRWDSSGKYVKGAVTRTEFNVVLLDEHGRVTEVVMADRGVGT